MEGRKKEGMEVVLILGMWAFGEFGGFLGKWFGGPGKGIE